MAKVKLPLSRMSPEELVNTATTVVTAMTGNANFPTPNPALAGITTQKTATQTKISGYNSAVTSTAAALTERDDAAEALRGLLSQLVSYVENASAGDPAKIESAGMAVRGNGSPVGPMPRVLELLLSEGDHAGFLDAMWKPIYGAKSYEIQTSADPMSEATWSFKMTAGKSSATLTGLTSGAKVWVRVRAIGADPLPGDWSDPAVKVVP